MHLGCTEPRLPVAPEGDWFCGSCTGNKDAYTVNLKTLGDDSHGNRYWMVGGFLWRELISTGEFFVVQQSEIARCGPKLQFGTSAAVTTR